MAMTEDKPTELERALGAYKHGHVSYGYVMDKLEAAIRGAVAAERADAERYRWLKARNPDALAAVAWAYSEEARGFSAAQVDEAVDAAIRAAPCAPPSSAA